jgi:hypothetical protein
MVLAAAARAQAGDLVSKIRTVLVISGKYFNNLTKIRAHWVFVIQKTEIRL